LGQLSQHTLSSMSADLELDDGRRIREM